MANEIYILQPTNQNTTQSFSISPYTTNGTQNPTSTTLDIHAVVANTSLLLFGQGQDDYGGKIQENMLHILENFSSDLEPVNPIHGQLWYDSNDQVLKAFNNTKLVISNVTSNNLTITLPGSILGTYQQKIADGALLRFISGFIFNVYEISTNNLITTLTSTGVVAGSNTTEIIVSVLDASALSSTPNSEAIGGWVVIGLLNNTALSGTTFANFSAPTDDVDIGGYSIKNIADPILSTDGVNKGYVDLAVTGGTLTTPGVQHVVIPNETFNGDVLSSFFTTNPTFPNIQLDEIINVISNGLRAIQRPNRNGIKYSLDIGTTPTVDILTDFGLTYTSGYNNLQIYVAGTKLVANERAKVVINKTVAPLLYASNSTGLDSGTAYIFTLTVDGTPLVPDYNVLGSDIQTYQHLVDSINAYIDGFRPGTLAKCVLLDGTMIFITDSDGSTSTISITDNNLFSSLSGGVVIDPSIPGVTNNYSEDNNIYGDTKASSVMITSLLGGGPPIDNFEFIVLASGGLHDSSDFEI